MKGRVWPTDVETLHHGGGDWVRVALAELVYNAINESGLAELYSSLMAVAGDRNSKGKFYLAQVRNIPVLLRPQLDVGGKFFVLLYVMDPYVRDPIGITFEWKGTDGGTD